jgi:plasmid maintenance system antidote protein VapI
VSENGQPDYGLCTSTSNNIPKGQSITAHVAKRNSNRCPTHPGALLREDVIPATGRTKAEIAQLLGISRQHLYDLLRERKTGVSRGGGAARQIVWRRCRSLVRMQAAYDTWNAERKEDVSEIPTLRAKVASSDT